MNDEQEASMRQQFEAWVCRTPLYAKNILKKFRSGTFRGQYQDYEVNLAWEAWQEATKQAYEQTQTQQNSCCVHPDADTNPTH